MQKQKKGHLAVPFFFVTPYVRDDGRTDQEIVTNVTANREPFL
jgi:hypothetical protein